MKEERIENLFLKEKPVKLIVKIRLQRNENYALQLSKEVNATYSHTVKVLQKMHELGLVEFEKNGRKKIVRLTDAGVDVADAFKDVYRAVEPHIETGELQKLPI
jgi:predicted transcriptional regulator